MSTLHTKNFKPFLLKDESIYPLLINNNFVIYFLKKLTYLTLS